MEHIRNRTVIQLVIFLLLVFTTISWYANIDKVTVKTETVKVVIDRNDADDYLTKNGYKYNSLLNYHTSQKIVYETRKTKIPLVYYKVILNKGDEGLYGVEIE